MFKDESAKKPNKFKWVAILVMGFLFSGALYFVSTAVVYSSTAEPQRRAQTRQPARRPAALPRRIDYSQFSHITHVTTEKLACDSCHKFPTKNWKDVRKAEAAFPDVAEFPEHSSCLNCHRQQFFARERPAPAICSNCHVSVTPRDTLRFLFPSLGDVTDSTLKQRELVSEFAVDFPHEKHLDVVGQDRPRFKQGMAAQFVSVTWSAGQKPPEQPKSCPVCHQLYQAQGNSSEEYVTAPPKNLGDNFWLKKGTFQSVPNSHAVCFTCHNADSGIPPDSKDCHVCHKFAEPGPKLKVDFDPKLTVAMAITDRPTLARWSRRVSAGAFRHEGGEHPALNCIGCHNVAVMNTLDVKTLKVPISSCGGAEGCHITATTDDGGALNFEIEQKKGKADFVCMKCHIAFGKETLPGNHLDAIPKPTTK